MNPKGQAVHSLLPDEPGNEYCRHNAGFHTALPSSERSTSKVGQHNCCVVYMCLVRLVYVTLRAGRGNDRSGDYEAASLTLLDPYTIKRSRIQTSESHLSLLVSAETCSENHYGINCACSAVDAAVQCLVCLSHAFHQARYASYT